ncbi:MAG: thiamine phosphate synthase [Desulfamplus sp.]|nr:thiamine phosphate synthase [Desulfamplus sp.]
MRIVDANLNRVAEGIRVIEDFFRFNFDSENNFDVKTFDNRENHIKLVEPPKLVESLRELRHKVRKSACGIMPELLTTRDVDGDIGFNISQNSRLDKREEGTLDIITANFKRIQEGIRSIEESLKSMNYYAAAKQYESLRYTSYNLEQECFRFMEEQTKKEQQKSKFPVTDIYCLTDHALSCGRSNIEVVNEMIRSGIKIIQYREKERAAFEKYRECVQIREMTKAAGVTFIVNDDVALAMMVGADGVHIGQSDYPVEGVRKLVGQDFIIGLSTHAPEEAVKAQNAGVDYIGVGPIYSTKTKKDVCSPVGHAYLEYVVKNISIPFVAIGGIKESNLHEITSRGARCVAMVSEITGAADIGAKIESIRQKINLSFKEKI